MRLLVLVCVVGPDVVFVAGKRDATPERTLTMDNLIIDSLPADGLVNYLCETGGMQGCAALKERLHLDDALMAWRELISARYGWAARADASERHLAELFGREDPVIRV
jgi:hypothetical protein